MTHEEAWRLLPDLLDDRDSAPLLEHVRTCPDCQRQLFLLGRVDRILHESATRDRSLRSRPFRRGLLAAATAVAVAAAVMVALLLPRSAGSHEFMFRTVSGRLVGEARMGHSDARNVSLGLTARHLPTGRGRMFVLWAGGENSSMRVGEFMVDSGGGCRVRFNLPATHGWHRFWMTKPGQTTQIVAST